MATTTITFGRPTVEPLHRSSWVRPTSGTGVDDFRVTQQFDDLDSYWSNVDPAKAAQKHRATDIGNARCGYPLVAMAPGRITHHVDNATAYGAPTNAIGSRLDVGPGSGVVIEYWHCDRHLVANGALVVTGTPIATVGKTGLGQVCHCHITCRVNGVLVDPEPLMFGGSITLGAALAGEEDEMRFGGAQLQPIVGAAQFRLTSDAHLRPTPARIASTKVFPAGTVFYASYTVDGEAVGTNDQWFETRLYDGAAYVLGYIHTSVGERIEPPMTGIDPAVAAKRIYEAADATARAARRQADSYRPS